MYVPVFGFNLCVGVWVSVGVHVCVPVGVNVCACVWFLPVCGYVGVWVCMCVQLLLIRHIASVHSTYTSHIPLFGGLDLLTCLHCRF